MRCLHPRTLYHDQSAQTCAEQVPGALTLRRLKVLTVRPPRFSWHSRACAVYAIFCVLVAARLDSSLLFIMSYLCVLPEASHIYTRQNLGAVLPLLWRRGLPRLTDRFVSGDCIKMLETAELPCLDPKFCSYGQQLHTWHVTISFLGQRRPKRGPTCGRNLWMLARLHRDNNSHN